MRMELRKAISDVILRIEHGKTISPIHLPLLEWREVWIFTRSSSNKKPQGWGNRHDHLHSASEDLWRRYKKALPARKLDPEPTVKHFTSYYRKSYARLYYPVEHDRKGGFRRKLGDNLDQLQFDRRKEAKYLWLSRGIDGLTTNIDSLILDVASRVPHPDNVTIVIWTPHRFGYRTSFRLTDRESQWAFFTLGDLIRTARGQIYHETCEEIIDVWFLLSKEKVA